MKKTFKALFIIGLMASPMFFSACEKDNGTIGYEDVDDDDWKKKAAITVDYEGEESSTVFYSAN